MTTLHEDLQPVEVHILQLKAQGELIAEIACDLLNDLHGSPPPNRASMNYDSRSSAISDAHLTLQQKLALAKQTHPVEIS